MCFIAVWVKSSGNKQKISNGSDDTHVHNGINETVSDHIGLVNRIQMTVKSHPGKQGKMIS